MKKPKTKATAKKPKSEPPEWLMDTPEIIYHLLADDHQGGDWKQEIELTYAEFDALKEHLASLRGIEVPPKEATNA